MARDKFNQSNIDKSDLSNYPNARIKDNTGAGNGTPVNEIVYGDLHEAFAKMMRLYGIAYNGLPDNESNGYQLVEAIAALAAKSDFVLPMTQVTAARLSIPIKLSKMQTDEFVICQASIPKSAHVQIVGSLDTSVTAYTVNFVGGDFLIGDYLRVIRTAAGVTIVRLVDGASFDDVAASFAYLKAATQTEEDLGATNAKATTPLTNFTAFANRIIGSASAPFLATPTNNGLMSIADKLKLDGLGNSLDRYGTITVGDVNTGSHPIGFNYPVSGEIQQAQVSGKQQDGEEITVTLNPGMTSLNYFVRIHIESLGIIELDNDLETIVFKKLTTTQFRLYVGEEGSVQQDIKLHLEIIQK